MQKKQIISELKTILKKAKINANLKKAIEETIKALNKDDLELAYELSAVKSFVSGDLKAKCYFREDDDYNNVHLGESVYSILDGIHHELAFKTGGIPSGMMILTSRGIIHKKEKAKKKHPVITMMEKERAKIYKEL